MIHKSGIIKRVAKRATGVFASCALAVALVPAGALALDGIEPVEPDDTLAASAYNYYLTNEDFFTAFAISGEASQVTVAVVDTGISMPEAERPEDLANTVDYEHAWDCSAGKSEPLAASFVDTNGHGTKVAHVLGSEVDNGLDGAGSSYNANILPINVYDKAGKADVDSLVRAYRHVLAVAEELNIKVVNLSLGSESSSLSSDEVANLYKLQRVITRAYNDYGILTVASAGNYSGDAVASTANYMYPAALDNVVAVSAVDKTSTIMSKSYRNRYVDVCAAGANIYFTEEYEDEDGNIVEATHSNGTSYSAAIVSGVAALMYNVNPELTASEAESILEGTAIDLGGEGYDFWYGNGLVGAGHAVYAAKLAYDASSTDGEESAEPSIASHSNDSYQLVTEESYVSGAEIYYHCPACGYEFTLETAKQLVLGQVKNVKKKSITAAKATITWGAVEGATGYEVTYKSNKSGAKWATVSIDASDSPSRVLSKLSASTTYKVKVRAYVEQSGKVVRGSYSSTIKFKTKAAK